MNNIDFNLYRVFAAIYREGSVSRAALQLQLTQPAVSNALARLRRRFDDPLFIRVAAGVQPTAMARALYPAVAEALSMLAAAANEVLAFNPKTSNRRFLLFGLDYLALTLMPPLLRRLRLQAPQAELRFLQISESEIAERFRAGEGDLAIGLYPRLHAVCDSLPLYTESFCLICARELAGRWSLDRYCRHPHIQVSTGTGGAGLIDRRLGELGVQRRVAYGVSQFAAVPYLVEDSDAIASVPTRVAAWAKTVAAVRSVKLPFAAPDYEIKLYWPRHARYDAGARWLRDGLRELAKSPLPASSR